MKVQAVVFDLDGTLFDHPTAALTGVRTWLSTLQRTTSPELEAAWLAAEDRHFRSWRDGQITFTEQRRRRLREILPLLDLPVGTDAELDAIFNDGYLRAYTQAWVAYDDVDATLTALQGTGLRTAVLTNGTREQQNAKIQAIGLTGRLGPVLTAEELGVAKPHPQAFLGVCHHLGVPANDVLYVGDDHSIDVLAARSAGLRAVHLDRTGTGRTDEVARISTLAGLLAHLAVA